MSSQTIINQFDFNSNPVTQAVVGPDALSAGATASSLPGGVGGTNGLGTTSTSDIDLVLNTNPALNVPGIDIS